MFKSPLVVEMEFVDHTEFNTETEFLGPHPEEQLSIDHLSGTQSRHGTAPCSETGLRRLPERCS